MAGRFLSEAEHQLVTDAVATAERGTDGEIVTIVNDCSDEFHDTGQFWSMAALFLYLALLPVFPDFFVGLADWFAGWGHWSLAGYLAWLLAGAVLVYGIARIALMSRALRIAMTLGAVKSRRSRERAIEFFKVGAERRTMGRTGILIYLSLAEHRAEIVADEAIAAKVEDEIWGEAMASLIEELRAGHPGQGMANAVERVGVVLAEHFPKTEGNPNELPDRLIEL